VVAALLAGKVEPERDPDLALRREPEAVRHHADDRVRHAADRQALRVEARARESPAPQALADDNHARAAGRVLLRREDATLERQRSQCPEERRRHACGAHPRWSVGLADVDARGSHRAQLDEGRALLAPRHVVVRRDGERRAVVRPGLPDDHQRAGIGEGEWPEDHGIDDREGCHARADADGQGENHGQGGTSVVERGANRAARVDRKEAHDRPSGWRA